MRPNGTASTETGEGAAKPCPICGKPAGVSHLPFCSKRCADVDLHRWLGGVYAVPAIEPGQTGLSGVVPDDED